MSDTTESILMLGNDGKRAKFGGEFNRLYMSQINNNLMDPTRTQTNYNTGVRGIAEYDNTGQVFDASVSLFGNNGDGADEEQTMTQRQAANNVMRAFEGGRSSTREERDVENYTSSSLAPELTIELMNEALATGSDAFVNEAGDGVEGVRQSNQTVAEEENYLKLPPKGGEAVGDLLNKIEDRKFRRQFDPFNMGVKALFDVAKREKEIFDLEQKRNVAFVERYKPVGPDTLNQEFIKFAKGFY